MRFLGNIEAKIDVKGRVFLPACFRKELSRGGITAMVMRKDVFQPCLVLYSEAVWNKELDDLRARLSRWSRDDQALFRQFVADAEPLTLDDSGRFLIPRRYINMAGIGRDVRFIGMDDTIEIWSANASEGAMLSPEDFSKGLQNVMKEKD
jgi:MraZ protein